MTKTFKRKDGTEEVVEGTPEELAEYERRLRESGNLHEAPKKKDILHGAAVDGIPLSEDEVSYVRNRRAIVDKFIRTMPAVQQPCITCSGAPCICRGIHNPYWLKVTCQESESF